MAEPQATETTASDDRQPRPRDGDRQPLDERGEPASAPSRAAQIAGPSDPRASAVTELSTALGLALHAPSSTRPRNSQAVRAPLTCTYVRHGSPLSLALIRVNERPRAVSRERVLCHDRDPMDPVDRVADRGAQSGQGAGVTP